jgi:hypothetical protein
MMIEAPGEPTLTLTWLGEENIPDPIIKPTISDRPFKYVNVLCFSNDTAPKPPAVPLADADAPRGAYPSPAVDERGKRFDAKSNVEETENVRP